MPHIYENAPIFALWIVGSHWQHYLRGTWRLRSFSGTANDGQPGSAVHGFVLAHKAAVVTLGSETGPANSSLCGNPQN